MGGDIRKKPEIEKCDMRDSVEEKQSSLSCEPFLLLKWHQAFIEFYMFKVGACVSVDLAAPLRWTSSFTFSCRMGLTSFSCALV